MYFCNTGVISVKKTTLLYFILMKKKLFLILCSFICLPLFSQNKSSITGQVSAKKGQPLSGVNIILDKGNLKAYTDEKGHYTIKGLSPGKHTISLSTLGYQSIRKTFSIKRDSAIRLNFILQEEPHQISEIVVRSKSKEALINQQAYKVKAVNAQKFYNSNVDAAGLLDRLPSIRVSQEGGLGSDYKFSMNGFSGKQVKFFLDGIPMDNFGAAFNLSTIPANSIDRIKVYKGVVPISLGSDALGGAVNIITNQKANFLDASYTLGSFNTHRSSINGAYTNPETGFTVRGNLNYNYADNDYNVKVEVAEDAFGRDTKTREVPRFHDRYRGYRAKFETGLVDKNFADQLLFGLIVSGKDQQVQNGITMKSVYGGITRETQSAIATLKYAKKDLLVDNLDLRFDASYSFTETQNVDTLQGIVYNWAGKQFKTPGAQTGEYGTQVFDESQYDNGFNTQFNLNYKIDNQHSLALNHAFEYFNRSSFDRRDPDKIVNQFPKSSYKNIIGLSYQYDFNKNWSTTLFGKAFFLTNKGSKVYGVVLDEDSRDTFKSSRKNFGYGMASSYFVTPNLQLKTSYEHTYRLPEPLEIFGDGLFTQANIDLKPEQSENFNLGSYYNFTLAQEHSFTMGGSFIYRNAQDLIFRVVTSSSPESSFKNLSKTRTLGMEANFHYNYANHLEIGGNITYQDITNQANWVYDRNDKPLQNFNKGARVPNRPFLFANANASYRFNNVIWKNTSLKLSYYYHFVQEYYLSWEHLGYKDSKNVIPQQNAHDIELHYSLKNGTYNIAFEIHNFTNEFLYDQFYLQKPGRAFSLKLRYAF